MIAAISFWVTPCAFAFFKWNTREESVIPEDMSATTVMILLVFTSMSWLFQFSPKRTSSLKCANWGANSPSAFLPAVCTIFAMFFLHFQIDCRLHDPGSCQSAAGFCFIIRILPNQRSPVWKLCLKAFLPRSLHQVRTVLILLLCCRIRCRRMSRRGRSSCL